MGNAGSGAGEGVQPKLRVTIGGRDITPILSNMQIKRGVNRVGEATLVLDVAGLEQARLDWQGEVLIDVLDPPTRLFTGVVEEALPVQITPTADIGGVTAAYAVRCVGPEVVLQETRLGPTAHARMPAADLLHLILRQVNWPRDRINIEGDDQLPLETIEVITPVAGLSITSTVAVGSVRLHGPGLAVGTLIEPLGSTPLSDQVRDATAWALALIDARMIADAAETGVHKIDVALAWLASRTQDGTTVRAGQYWPYRRPITTAAVNRGQLIVVHGLTTGRLWASLPGSRVSVPIALTGSSLWAAAPMSRTPAATTELALVAWARAQAPGAFERRVQALWDCLEYYAASAVPSKMYTQENLDTLKAAFAEVQLTDEQAARVRDAIGRLNDAPLMVKIKIVAQQDGDELTADESGVLKRLRRARNAVSHGKAPAPGRIEDLRHALSIVARLLARHDCVDHKHEPFAL